MPTSALIRRACALGLGAIAGLGPVAAHAQKPRGALNIYWIDVEGGAATLIATPAGESVLIDAGSAGDRDAARIVKAAREAAKVDRIDYLIVTHFDSDHYGGVADLAPKIEIGKVLDPGLPPEGDPLWAQGVKRYADAVGTKRETIKPGDKVPLRGRRGIGVVQLECLAAQQQFIAAPPGAPANPACTGAQEKAPDTSQNANSVVMLMRFGQFAFLDAADLTWNLEAKLVCPVNLAGQVDIFQVDHHGLDLSNNPALVRAIQPTVAIINNGARKGPGPQTFKTLTSTPSIKAIFQMHKNLDAGDTGNTAPNRIANLEEKCSGEIISVSVAIDSGSFRVDIPSTRASESWQLH